MSIVWLPVNRWECHVGMYDFVGEAEKSHQQQQRILREKKGNAFGFFFLLF